MLRRISLALLVASSVAARNAVRHSLSDRDFSRPGDKPGSYDYIVVGSGPGGAPLAANLARAGHSVILLEAGDDQGNNPNVSLIGNFNTATNDPSTRWDFWTKHSEDPERELKFEHMVWRTPEGDFYTGLNPPAGSTQLGIWYPRAGTLGGCAMRTYYSCYLCNLSNVWSNTHTMDHR